MSPQQQSSQKPHLRHRDLVLLPEMKSTDWPHLGHRVVGMAVPRFRLISNRGRLDKNSISQASRCIALSPFNTITYSVETLAVKCPYCGAENRDIANYCLRCGNSMIAPPTLKPQQPPQLGFHALQIRTCIHHPSSPAQYNCLGCGSPICQLCARMYHGSIYCPACYDRRMAVWISRSMIQPSALVLPQNWYGRPVLR